MIPFPVTKSAAIGKIREVRALTLTGDLRAIGNKPENKLNPEKL
jgi:hypothetical protein